VGEVVQGRLLACAVGLLSRSITFSGDVSDSADGYGAHMVVGQVVLDSDVYPGIATLQGVEFVRAGQVSSEHPAVLFAVPTTGLPQVPGSGSVVRGCSFDSNNYAVVAQNSRWLQLHGNVVRRSFRTAFDVDARSLNVNIVGNLVAGVVAAPDETLDWVRPIAAFYVDVVADALQGNVAAGSADSGFVIRAPSCGAAAATSGAYGGNEAHAVLVGVFILPRTPGTQSCLRLHGWTVWLAAHLGVVTVDQTADVHLSDMLISDSHIGVSLNYVSNDRQAEATGELSVLRDSFVFGSTPVSTCSSSLTCRAMTGGDVRGSSCNSVLGTYWRRVGVMVPQYTNRGKLCESNPSGIPGNMDVCRPANTPDLMCSMPWEKRHGLPSVTEARMSIDNVTFAHFDATDCGMHSTAVSLNPSQPDWSPTMHLSRIAWAQVDVNARLFLGFSPSTNGLCTSGDGCDSYRFALVKDVDGSVGGSVGASIISEVNPQLAMWSPGCIAKGSWGAFYCPGLANLVPAVFQDRVRDVVSQSLARCVCLAS
jgi:hypothetical protein